MTTTLTHEAVLDMFRRVSQLFEKSERDAERRQQEAERQRQEVERERQETARLFRESKEAAERQRQETAQQITDLNRRYGGLSANFGRFVEEMVRPAVVRLFQERGLPVHSVHPNVHYEGPKGTRAAGFEIDLLVVNSGELIAVECKVTLTTEDVDEHKKRLLKVRELSPEYHGKRLIGAVATMNLDDEVQRYAVAQGFYVLAQNGEAVEIRNAPEFEPKGW